MKLNTIGPHRWRLLFLKKPEFKQCMTWKYVKIVKTTELCIAKRNFRLAESTSNFFEDKISTSS